MPPKLLRYADRVFRKYDVNGDGALDASEWDKMRGAPKLLDIDRNGSITPKELARYIYLYGRAHRLNLAVPIPTPVERASARSVFRPASSMPLPEQASAPQPENPAAVPSEMTDSDAENEDANDEDALMEGEENSAQPVVVRSQSESSSSVRRKLIKSRKFSVPRAALPAGAPEWFRTRDYDGDGQISLAEFAPNPTREDRLEFNRYDLDGDGVVTAKEAGGRGNSRSGAASVPGSVSSRTTTRYPSPTAVPAASSTKSPKSAYGAAAQGGTQYGATAYGTPAYGATPYKPYGATSSAVVGGSNRAALTPYAGSSSTKSPKSSVYGVPAGTYAPPQR